MNVDILRTSYAFRSLYVSLFIPETVCICFFEAKQEAEHRYKDQSWTFLWPLDSKLNRPSLNSFGESNETRIHCTNAQENG